MSRPSACSTSRSGAWFGAPAGLLAGFGLATTPAAALMFRYNNPDALLVLCWSSVRTPSTRGDRGRAHALGRRSPGPPWALGFLAKELQAFLVLPGFAAAYARRRAWLMVDAIRGVSS